MSMTLAIEAGIASYVGVGAAVTVDGAGSEAARAAAIDVAAIFFFDVFERTNPMRRNHETSESQISILSESESKV